MDASGLHWGIDIPVGSLLDHCIGGALSPLDGNPISSV
jgi:hypothetical protein